MRTKFLHKCSVYWSIEDKIWIVSDRGCGDFAQNRSWRRAVYLGIYHFKMELEEATSRVLKAHTLREF